MTALIQVIETICNLSHSDATAIFDAYCKAKVITYNSHDGYRVTHGFWLDKATLLSVLENVKANKIIHIL